MSHSKVDTPINFARTVERNVHFSFLSGESSLFFKDTGDQTHLLVLKWNQSTFFHGITKLNFFLDNLFGDSYFELLEDVNDTRLKKDDNHFNGELFFQ